MVKTKELRGAEMPKCWRLHEQHIGYYALLARDISIGLVDAGDTGNMFTHG